MDGTRAARARQRGFAPAGVRLGRRLAVASVLVLAACSSKPPPSLEPVPVVQVVRPDGGDQDGAVRATGVFRWTREAALSFAIPGTITRLLVDQGDVVTPGQLVAVIDPTAVQARTAQTAADLQQARKDLERYEPLLKKGFISSQQYERLRTAAASAQAAHDTAVFDLKRARLVSQVRGAVLRRSAQAGEVVQAGQAVVTVADETSGLVLRVPISSREAPRLAIGAAAQIRLSDGSHMAGQVARIG
jgi:RND family efflux transporter MFP subunit